MRGLLLGAMLALVPGCRQTRCDELERVPVAGTYRGGGSLGEERLLRVSLAAANEQVVLRWTMKDGAQIRATYRVTKKLKKP